MSIIGPELNEHGFNDQNIRRVNMPPRMPGVERLGIFNGSFLLENRRLDLIDDPSIYPEGSILEIRNRRMVFGVEVADILVNFYIFQGIGDEFFWFGTDYLGRDLFTRMFRGARVSLFIAFVAVAANIIIGTIYGAIAGYFGGTVDMVLMRVCEVLNSIPFIVIMILFIMAFGTGIFSIIMAFVVRGWIGNAILIRFQVYRFKSREYVLAARTLGVPNRILLFRHILPNCLSPLITSAMMAIPSTIFFESFLAYIGLGLQAPEPSIGVMLAQGQRVLLHFPTQTLFPAILISVIVIAFNLLANGLRDALDPTMRGVI